MSRAGVGCRVMIDGLMIDDGCIDWNAPPIFPTLGPGVYVGDGLQVTWGRSNTVDQPEASTCTFRLLDEPGALTYATAVKVGSTVDVFADARVPGEADLQAFLDGGFETGVNGTAGANSRLDRSGSHVHTGSYSARLTPRNAANAWSARLAPGPLQPEGTNPGAWDALPITGAGQTWAIALDLFTFGPSTVTVRPVLYSGPYASTAVVGDVLAELPAGTGGWAHVDVEYVPDTPTRWVGVHVTGLGSLAWDEVDPGITWDAVPGDISWDDFGSVFVDDVSILAPGPAPLSTTLVFSGRVTDLEVAYDDELGQPGVDVTAADMLADLGNRPVGDSPWDAERLDVRVRRILDLAVPNPADPPIVADIAPTVAGTIVSYHDVDRQPAAGLLTDLSQSVDGILWSATHVSLGPYVRIEDPAARPSMFQLSLIGGLIVIVAVDFSALPEEVRPLMLSACDLLRDPVEFHMSVADVASSVAIEWLEQTGTDPTARRYVLRDAARERYVGARSIAVSTLLTTQADAVEVAEAILSRSGGDWRVAGVEVDDAEFVVPDAEAARAQLRLLDGVERGGLPVQVTDMPDWNPIGEVLPAYVEGGDYTFTGGGWRLALTVSRAVGLGTSATWNSLDPTWTWSQWDPGLTWDDLRGVAGPPLPTNALPEAPPYPENALPTPEEGTP
jgi:hypothetical protein